MSQKRSILIVTSELAPFAKTGGLADMAAAMADQLKVLGHDVRVVLPLYRKIRESGRPMTTVLDSMCVWMGTQEIWCAVRQVTTRGGVPVYLIEQDAFFDRSGLYHDDAYNDYYDNPSRFGFFSRAALQVAADTGFAPDIVQINDWQTAPVAAYLKTWFWNHPALGKAACALTIHNVAYQGTYDGGVYKWLGFNPQHFLPHIFEDFGRLNLLKGGIHYSDVVNTVSPTHAREITEPYGGFGLAPYLTNKGAGFKGILNGVDYAEWSPDNDTHIPAKFSVKSMKGKAVCKAELQKKFGLAEDPNCAVIGLVGRLASQKGLHLVRDTIEWAVQGMHVQFVILGSGDPDLETYFGGLPAKYPGRIGTYIGFNNDVAHLIEAGSDFFLMPSMYEPCGLNQMYSLRYGTLPIVRATGGLDDTVDNYDEATGSGTGFKFWEPTREALFYTIGWAISTYYDRKHHMKKLVENAMKKDYSWEHAVNEYLEFFEEAIAAKKAYDASHPL